MQKRCFLIGKSGIWSAKQASWLPMWSPTGRISHYVSDTTRNGNSRRVYNSSTLWAIKNGANLFLSVTSWKFNGFCCSFWATVSKTIRLMLSTYRRRMSVTPEKLFKNLNVKYWISVHFHTENGVFYTEYLNIKWTNWRFMHEKVGGQKALFDPALEKVGVNWPPWPRASAV